MIKKRSSLLCGEDNAWFYSTRTIGSIPHTIAPSHPVDIHIYGGGLTLILNLGSGLGMGGGAEEDVFEGVGCEFGAAEGSGFRTISGRGFLGLPPLLADLGFTGGWVFEVGVDDLGRGCGGGVALGVIVAIAGLARGLPSSIE